jgi:transketolase
MLEPTWAFDMSQPVRQCLSRADFQMGIATEQASVAAGLSLTGKIPFINSFAVFASGRAYDQIRSSITIATLNVKICGSSAGLSDYGDGKTHQSIDDIALMQVLPNMTVLSPCDAVETEQMVKAMVENKGPMYIRINRNDLPVVTDPNPSITSAR